MKQLAVAAVFALAACQTAYRPGDATLLTGDDLVRHLAGRTVHGRYADGATYREYYAPDGTVEYEDAEGRTTGRWMPVDDEVCYSYEDPGLGSACFNIFLRGDALEFVRDGELSSDGIAVLEGMRL
ncbi:MAG TPA: hypothetical protein VFO41_16450 [Alphaproteobacteria bacterium]|nr:hypothetical protein [Alphaproteobacteria bacterium]